MAPPRHRPSGFGASSGGAWEIGMVRMPFFVPGDDGVAIRPLLALVMDGSGLIRATASGHPEHPSEALAKVLQQAIHHPPSGLQPGNPQQVVVPSARLLEALRPLLPDVAIEVGPTPHLDTAMAALREDFQVERKSGDDQATHTYLTADITPDAMAGFFEAAAALYERKPWQVIPSDAPLFQVSSTALGIRGWTGCVIGQNRESHGVIMFDSIAAYEHYVQLAKIAEQQGTIPGAGFPRQRAINYEPKAAMPASLLKEIARYHWPVAKGDGYPTVMLIEPDLVLAPPTREDLGRLEGVARALVRLIDDIPDLPRRWREPEGLRKRYRLTVQGQEVSMTIGVAGDAPVAPSQQAQERQERVPAAMQAKVDALMQSIDGFCDSHLNAEYRQLLLAAVCALARKRPSPLLGGREPSWCAGIVHAIGMANFLFDKTQTPHCKAPEIYAAFGVSAQTGQAHSKKVRDLLKIGVFDPKWTLPSKLDDSPLAWMLEVDGFIMDIRTMPLDIQIQACAQGLIPYVPALRRDDAAKA
ncbi:MAG: DUF6398 domain-containing protein [Cyanobacteriota bacterium]